MSEFVTSITIYLIMAAIVEFVVQIIKNAIPDDSFIDKHITPALWSIIVSLIICFTFNLDLFSLFGLVPAWSVPAIVLTAIALSTGSTPLHHLFDKIRSFNS